MVRVIVGVELAGAVELDDTVFSWSGGCEVDDGGVGIRRIARIVGRVPVGVSLWNWFAGR